MSRRYLRSVLLGLFAVCVVKPVASKMCDRLCNDWAECSSPSDLLCYLTEAKDVRHLHAAGKGADRMYADRNLTSPKDVVIYRTRDIILLCRPRYADEEENGNQSARSFLIQTDKLQRSDNCSQQRKKKEQTRLLMLPGSANIQGRQLFLHNNSVVLSQYIGIKAIVAAAYVSAARKLLIATRKPIYLLSVNDQGNTSIMMKHRFITSIAGDEETPQIFLAFRSYPRIGVMTIDGKNFRSLVNLRSLCVLPNIAADPKRNTIYVICKNQYIRKYTYKGRDRGNMVKGYMHRALYFDLQNDVLYYMSGFLSRTVYSLSLSNGSVTKIKELTVSGYTMYVIDNTIYVIDVKEMLTVVPEKGEMVTIDTGFDPRRAGRVVACLIT